MSSLFLDLGMGAAGDMLMAGLYDLLSDSQKMEFENKINNAGIDGINVKLLKDMKCGIIGYHANVSFYGEQENCTDVCEQHNSLNAHHHEEHIHHHDAHEHNSKEEHSHHENGHHHYSMEDVVNIVKGLNVSERVKSDVSAIYNIIADAESRVHNKPVSDIHFHELGRADALADITGVAILMEMLSFDRVYASPVNTGFGKVRCAHGILPVPAPATAIILEGVPCFAGSFEGEMCTPTGAAIVKYYADSFQNMPMMTIEATGYGTGQKDFPAANVVRCVKGTLFGNEKSREDEVIELRCNMDDITGEELAFAMELLLENGARDVFCESVMMKKNRPGIMLCVLCDKKDREIMAKLIFKHTTTIGIREYNIDRMRLERTVETVSTGFGEVRVKNSSGFDSAREKYEFDDLKRIAKEKNMSVFEVRNML